VELAQIDSCVVTFSSTTRALLSGIAAVTKPAKLYAQLLQSTDRSVDFRDFIAMVEAFGFMLARTKGSHRSFAHPSCPKLLVLQPNGKDAKRYQVREFLDMIEEFGLTLEA
jgi:predicted RNA binding protein YcfA (HicA-like mRNA interferase family)